MICKQKSKSSAFTGLCLLLLSLLLLTSCAKEDASEVHVVLEEGEGFHCSDAAKIIRSGEDVSFSVSMEEDYEITSREPEHTGITEEEDGSLTVTLKAVSYPTVITLTAEKLPYQIRYHENLPDGASAGSEIPADRTLLQSAGRKHLRVNTLNAADSFRLDGYTLTGYNTAPDGSGTHIGLGSRCDALYEKETTLYAEWSPWDEASLFTFETLPDGTLSLTGFSGQAGNTDKENTTGNNGNTQEKFQTTGNYDTLTIPGTVNGQTVTEIGEHALSGGGYRILILPDTLRRISLYAFSDSSLEELYLFDNLIEITDYAVEGCENFHTLHINAATPPVYAGNYFASFTDKTDRLRLLSGQRKLILFSGSSTRFGYDCEAIDEALSDYAPVNMGVFAYTNALPQLELCRTFTSPGDILLHAPEFDAAKRQFCTTNEIDDKLFAMIETDYDLLTRLSLTEYRGTLTAFQTFLKTRRGMTPRSYSESPADYDEDGQTVSTPSYNMYGDYITYRPNASDDAPIYELPVDYVKEAFPKSTYIEPLNAEYQRFLSDGVTVYFTYAPRNAAAISDRSTKEARAELEEYFKESLIVPVISELEESLYPGRYLYGTDNHLSTEGVGIRTKQILKDLSEINSNCSGPSDLHVTSGLPIESSLCERQALAS